MTRTKTLMILLAATAATTAMACPFCKVKKTGLFLGDVSIMGNGTVRSWIDIAEDGKPKAIAVTFNELALQNLPDQTDPKMPPEFTVKLPEAAKAITAFDHVGINWNPYGHPPKEIYGPEHFDFHFYTIEPSVRTEITLKGNNLKKRQAKPEAKLMPEKYMYAPQSEEPYMGAHWVDLTSPELAGAPFTSTFIYGSYDSKVIFYEPMITKKMIESKQAYKAPVRLPEQFVEDGWYPTAWTLSWDETRREFTVALTDFVERKSEATKAAEAKAAAAAKKPAAKKVVAKKK